MKPLSKGEKINLAWQEYFKKREPLLQELKKKIEEIENDRE